MRTSEQELDAHIARLTKILFTAGATVVVALVVWLRRGE